MRYHLIILFWGFILASSGAAQQKTVSVQTTAYPEIESCNKPLTWKFGEIDSQFDIDNQTIQNLMTDIGDMWSDAVGKNLIAYSDTGVVELNLIYSDAKNLPRMSNSYPAV